MKDLWTIASYPTAAVTGYFAAIPLRDFISAQVGLTEWASTVTVLVAVGLAAGFLVDEVIPAYVHEKRGAGASGGGNDFEGGGDLDGGDFNFD